MLTVIGLAAASCSQDELTGNRGLNGNAVKFSIVASSTPAEDTPETRALNADDTPVMLLAPGGQDTLYLHPWVTENHSVPSASQNKATTRGVPVDEHNFASVCKSFGVTAYTQDGKRFMQNEKISKVSNGVWSPDETYFWPAGGTLDFYAYAPYEQTINIKDKAITFDYIVPDQATLQPDIMFAHATGSKKTGTVSLGFKHALAGVKFVAKDVTNCTVKSITLQNLYGEGLCTYDTETKTFTWTMSGDKKEFSQAFDVTLKEQENGAQPITDKKPETTFMLIPQSLDGVTVEVALETTSGESFTLTGSLAQTGTWEAGKIYTYAISTESINWVYEFEVTPDITLPLGTTAGQYTVKSYRYRRGNSNVKEPVAWSAENTSSSEKNLENNTSTNVPFDEILSEFTYKEEAPTVTNADYVIKLTRTTLHTNYPGDLTLKNNQQKGSPDNPYDLSTEGGTINQTTANCYVVNAAGTYQLPLVYGNAIKNGGANYAAYSGGAFKDYKDQTISGSDIKGADDAVLVWSDGFYLFKDIKLSDDKKYLIFTIDPDYMQQANAVLAVRDANDDIMWSWHIWVTEHKVLDETYTVHGYSSDNTHYNLMQCNLGWVDGKSVYYNQRNLTFKFVQAGSGETDELNVTQEGAKFDYKDVGSTYYQWGRKDPLVALRNWDAYRFEDYRLHETGKPDYIYRCETGPASLGTSIQHPNVFYTRKNDVTDWNSEHIATLWNVQDNGGQINSTTSTKTIYDPSPRGFKVPVPRTFAIFVNGGTSTTEGGTLKGEVDPDNSHRYLISSETNNDGIEIPLTATGQRADRAGLEVYFPKDGKGEVGGLWALYGVYYWTCVHEKSGSSSAYTLVIRKDQPSGIEVYSYGFVGAKTMARPVRPVKED